MSPTLFCLSLIGGFFSGLLGVGGAVVLIPLILAIPPLVGTGHLTMNEAAGITMVQVLATSISGCLAHKRNGFTHTKTILAIGVPMGFFSLAGAFFSKRMDNRSMLLIFGFLVILAFILLLQKISDESAYSQSEFVFNTPRSITIGSAVGLVSGIVGAGGGFILIPLMITVLKIPIRITVGSSLGIVFIGALMGSIGKVLSLQVKWIYLLPVLIGSIPAAQIGAWISKSIPVIYIRRILISAIFLILIGTWWNVLLRTASSP